MRVLFVIFFALVLQIRSFAQLPEQKDFQWPDNFVNYNKVADSLQSEDAVILKEELTLNPDIIKRRVAVRIQNAEAVQAFAKIQLPENFDLTNYPNLNKQGRFKNRKDPFIYSFKVRYFAARLIKPDKKIVELPVKYLMEKVQWVDLDGSRFSDMIYNFKLEQIEPGDILEYTYRAEVDWNLRQFVVYPNSIYPKFDYTLKATIKKDTRLSNSEMIYGAFIPEANVKHTLIHEPGIDVVTNTYHYNFLNGVRYPASARVGATLPSISINNGAYRSINTTQTMSDLQTYMVFDKYKWILSIDTNPRAKIYDKYHANLRKFMTKFDDIVNDTTGVMFFDRLVDTLNSFRFLTAESMSYSDNPQYAIPSSEHLLKGRLPEEFVFKNYSDFLEEKGVFFYTGYITDKRYSNMNPEYRNHYFLERKLLIVPVKKSYRFYMTRINGIKYFPDELPFYFEGTGCMMVPCYNCKGNATKMKLMSLSTPKSNFNANTRSEAATIKVYTDSLKASVFIKENLNGQFSTLLRHYYNRDLIDSTVPSNYYKKCIDKPGVKNVVVKQTFSSKTFPFKQSYICTGAVPVQEKEELNLKNWFSFFWDSESYKKQPNHDFYFDFQFTDTYNLLFEFDKAVEVMNTADFEKKLSNDQFEASCGLVKQDANKFLLNVVIKIKEDKLPKERSAMLLEFIKTLDAINNLRLSYKIL